MSARAASSVKSALFSLVALGAVVVGLELGARALRGALGWSPESGLNVPHPTLLWRMRPNFTGKTHDTPVTTNSLGLRGPEPRPKAATAGGRRIRLLVIGDSIGLGFAVAEEDSWPRLLERDLRLAWEREGLDIEVVNGAAIGYGTFQEAAFLQEMGPRLAPDLVLWQFCSNDVVENHVYAPRARLRLLLDRSSLFNLMRDVWLRARGARTYEEADEEAPPRGTGARPGQATRGRQFAKKEFGVMKEDAVFAQDKPELLAAAWARTADATGRIARTAKDAGTEVVCVVFPAGTQVFGDNRSTVLQDSVASLCAREAIPVIDLLEAFRGQHGTYRATHPTAKGNELAARVTSERLAPAIARLAERAAAAGNH